MFHFLHNFFIISDKKCLPLSDTMVLGEPNSEKMFFSRASATDRLDKSIVGLYHTKPLKLSTAVKTALYPLLVGDRGPPIVNK